MLGELPPGPGVRTVGPQVCENIYHSVPVPLSQVQPRQVPRELVGCVLAEESKDWA